MPPWKQNRVIYTKQELSWDKPLCRGREVQERGVKKFTGVLRIPAISSNFWLFMFFYPSLSLAVTLVSHGGPGFKLVAVLLLTFGSKSELLHILTDLSGVASSCKLICPPPPTPWPGFTGCGCSVWTCFLPWDCPANDYLFSGGGLLTGAHLSLCPGSLVCQLLWLPWASCQPSTAGREWLSLLLLIPLPLPCHVYFHDKSPKKDFQCVLTGWNCVIRLDLVKSPIAKSLRSTEDKACRLWMVCLFSWGRDTERP